MTRLRAWSIIGTEEIQMAQVNVHEAKTQLSKLLARVAAGEEIVIAKGGKPVARLVPMEAKRERRALGMDAGQKFFIADDFDAPLPPEIQKYFE
jgi:prevent-host-death family protein